ncbi:hypothetical protein [Pelagovum pacificum]|uniref:DUF1795 domain-containing protein n=1 Tax=Pelagovum pacificum TaxID=2588711 RepID=A0A5C5GDA9_9RHOB|nr:hypothetical protein [Pelagovum pacificum]QQA44748.1 hypothetical protein I8N54_09335 [Pelagovum pacificum]TNY32144.1 hypothetical protein FHY64_02260 [Pelagovum pacificum]
MTRLLALVLSLGLAGAAQAQTCSPISQTVEFCPDVAPWAGVAPRPNPEYGGWTWANDEIEMQLLPLDYVEGEPSAERRIELLEQFAVTTNGEMVEFAPGLGDAVPATTGVFFYPESGENVLALVTVYFIGGGTWALVTSEYAATLTDMQADAHFSALDALKEVP